MRRWQIYLILALLVSFFAAFAYYYGFAVTVILVIVTLNYIMNLRSFKTLKRLIVESQHILGENDRKLLKKIQSIEDRLDG
jgi:uncharacterized membrane protein